MARVLIVGCGCRGRALGEQVAADGHEVRGTSRSPDGTAAIEAAGIEAVTADPLRLGTVLMQLEGVGVLVWLMGSASGDDVAPLHDERLRAIVEKLVDTPVRGIVYEAAGSADPGLLERGAAITRAVAATYRMPVGLIEEPWDAADGGAAWLASGRSAVAAVLES